MTEGVYRYDSADFRTGRLAVTELPLQVSSFSSGLGVAEGTLAASAAIGKVDVEKAFAHSRRVIWCYRDDYPVGAYVPVGRQPVSSDASSVSIICPRFDAIPFDAREVWDTLVFDQVDQLVIARNVMAYALGLFPSAVQPAYLMGLQQLPAAARIPWLRLDSTLSGRRRDYGDNDSGILGANHPRVSDVLTKMMQLIDGFEYRPVYGLGADQAPYAQIDLSPGNTFDAGQDAVLGLEYPGTILSFTYGTNTSDTETMSRSYGSGPGSEKRTGAVAYDFQAFEEGWPVLMGSDTTTETEQASVDESGRQRLEEHAGELETFTFTVSASYLTQLRLGDRVYVSIDHPLFPYGRGGQFRVLGWSVTPAADTMLLTVMEVEG